MILSVGEILYDIFPEYRRIGGAPFNFAFHLKSLGFPLHFISRVGNDEPGKGILAFLEEKGFETAFIQQDPQHKSGEVIVQTDENGVPEFDIVPDRAYDYLEFTAEIAAELQKIPRLIYYGTLIQRSPRSAETLMKILEKRNPGTRCIYDMNLRPRCYDRNAIIKSLIHCDVLKLSDDELGILKSLLRADTPDPFFIEGLMHNYAIEMLCLTRGKEGSSLFTKGGLWSADTPEDIRVRDTVGAGDAFAAILAAGFLKNWEPGIILKRAAAFAGAVCGIAGAIPHDTDFYAPYTEWTKENSE